MRTLTGHKGSVLSAAALGGGRLASGGSEDNTIKIWDVETGKYVRTLKGHSHFVRSPVALDV